MLHLEQRMLLQQKLSPQQVLFSTLLQLPVLALEQRLKIELEMNPLLEEDQEIDENSSEEEPLEQTGDEEEVEAEDSETEEVEWDEILNDVDNYGYNPDKEKNEEVSMPDPAPVTLTEYLLSQFHMLLLSSEETKIGEYLIWNINEDGYLSDSLDEIAEQLQAPQAKIEQILKIIQKLDPVGIGARNLQECLLVQLEEKPELNGETIKLIRDYFEDFKNKRFEKIAKSMGLPLEVIKHIIDTISRLNPKPGEGYIIPAQNYVIPDVIIEKIGNDFVISLNDWNVPRLRINNAYRRMLTNPKKIPETTKRYIKQKIEAARWVINSIEQRKDTILRVSKSIVARQMDFFEHGHGHVKPMILKDIADDIGMDISTISRVTNGKYAQTDYGVFELKYFFSERMTTSDGEQVSTLSIKDKIKEIVAGEDQKHPLTDDKIVKLLSVQGIPIARRTIAKYREQMRIPVARMRREI